MSLLAPPLAAEAQTARKAPRVVLLTGGSEPVRLDVSVLIATRDNISVDHVGRLVDLAARFRMPAMYGTRPFADAGGLIAYRLLRADHLIEWRPGVAADPTPRDAVARPQPGPSRR